MCHPQAPLYSHLAICGSGKSVLYGILRLKYSVCFQTRILKRPKWSLLTKTYWIHAVEVCSSGIICIKECNVYFLECWAINTDHLIFVLLIFLFFSQKKLIAEDLDSPPNGQIHFSIVNGDQDNEFSVDPVLGLVKVKKKLDRERVRHVGLLNLQWLTDVHQSQLCC